MSGEIGGLEVRHRKFFRTMPSKASENAPFRNKIWLVLIIEVYKEKQYCSLKLASLNFADLDVEREKFRSPLLLAVECLYVNTKKRATSRQIYPLHRMH